MKLGLLLLLLLFDCQVFLNPLTKGHVVFLELPRGKHLFTLCTSLHLFARGSGRTQQLIGCQSDTGVGFQTMHKEHVLVVLEVIFKISVATDVVMAIAYAEMFVKFFLIEEYRQTHGAFQILGVVVVLLVF